jgi:EAL domain-containing protein (putative c-di-GMP-specific phosphodiesterase class I)/GGDEF domain-containing protein/CBS domain-containing protein
MGTIMQPVVANKTDTRKEVWTVPRKTDAEILDKILEDGCIMPVYQPIVSLTDGQVYGYEALSRVSDDELKMNIEQMFRTADRMNRAWELETLCRTEALLGATEMEADKKLFLNVNPNIIHDDEFKDGFTSSRLTAYNLKHDSIIFEITERVAVTDRRVFLDSISHYKSQNYNIAIDDVGAGYAGLNILHDVKPDIIKFDMNLIRDVDKDEIKQMLCKAMVDFCKAAGIKSIAEGIETEEELATLIKLDVDLGQGYFLGTPKGTFADITPEKVGMINKYHTKIFTERTRSSVYPIVGHISRPGNCFSPDEKVESIHDALRQNPTITEFTVLEDNVAIGLMTRVFLNEMLGGRYGFNLYANKPIRQIVNPDIMRVNYNMPVDQVSRLAMQRTPERQYDPIVVEDAGEYSGIVTIKDLLDSCTKIEIEVAAHSNPLTGLPGNLLIEKEIVQRVLGKKPYCIIYFDVDHFKAYNDAYGFQNGDKMLALLAEVLKQCAVKNEFVGHIGGDDFIVICDYHEGEDYCKSVIAGFSSQVPSLYRDEDIKNGYIVSKNRSGVTENFPITSLSIAGISNREKTYQNMDNFSHDIAKIKKKCKQHSGYHFEIH